MTVVVPTEQPRDEHTPGAHRRPLVAIIGGRAQNVADERDLKLAEQVGAELAARGYGVVSGGDDGVAEAVNKGCHQAGGVTIAVTKEQHRGCGPYVSYVVPTAMDLSRSAPLLWAGDAVIAFRGRFGTMFELGLALDAERPVVLVGEPTFVTPEVTETPGVVLLPDLAALTATQVVDAVEALLNPLR
ncbi:hypothetical protein [Kitasatospora sp. NPDC097643]|uniref:SLOG cluster 4 domain-containing protein n=1 Tax=Kitasatospora sp. NPDC097643 TaxID=3157230 RepID=UPI00332B29C7